MDAWAIVVITISSGLLVFILLFCLKQRKNRQRNQQPMHSMPVAVYQGGQMMPTNNLQSVAPSFIPSTNNQGPINLQNPQVYYNQNLPQFVQVQTGGNPLPPHGYNQPPPQPGFNQPGYNPQQYPPEYNQQQPYNTQYQPQSGFNPRMMPITTMAAPNL